MKKVLFIAYHFPPIAGGGTFRSLKFVKYLPEFGWQPTVITTNSKNCWAYDNSLLDEIPENIKIIRASEFNPFYLHIILSKIKLGKLYDVIKRKFFIPDEKIGWIPMAYQKAKKELKNNKYNLIFSTSPTPCAHIIANKLKLNTNINWIADYRDHWTLNPEYYHKGKRLIKEQLIEKNIHINCDKIIVNTYGNKNDLFSHFRNIEQSKFKIITNGYDDTHNASNKLKKQNKLIFTYSGTFYGKRNPFNLLKAISKIKQHINSIDIQFNFIGNSIFDISKLSKEYQIENYVKYIKFMKHSDLQNKINTTSIFILLIDSTKKSPHVVPSKLYDYLKYKKPILSIIHKGDSYNILNTSRLGFFADPNSVDDIKNQILNMYNLWKENKLNPKPNTEYIKQFHRRNLTKQLAEVFESVI